MNRWLVIGAGCLALSLGAGVAVAQQQDQGGDRADTFRARMIDHFIEMLDTNHDGAVSAAEAEAGRRSPFPGLDSDADGSLSRSEFVDGMTARLSQGLGQRFDRMDADKNGTVSAEEFQQARATMMRDRMHHGRHGDHDGWSGHGPMGWPMGDLDD